MTKTYSLSPSTPSIMQSLRRRRTFRPPRLRWQFLIRRCEEDLHPNNGGAELLPHASHRTPRPQTRKFPIPQQKFTRYQIDRFRACLPLESRHAGGAGKQGREKIGGNSNNQMIQSYYIAPEIISGSYNHNCDIWSAGVILYILLTAVPPFDGDSDKAIIE